MRLFMTYAEAYILTLLLEVLGARIFWRVFLLEEEKERLQIRRVLLLVLVNLLTNPLAVLINQICAAYLPITYIYLWQVLIEALVILVEAVVYRSYRKACRIHRPFLMAIMLNAFSYGCGLILDHLGEIHL